MERRNKETAATQRERERGREGEGAGTERTKSKVGGKGNEEVMG
jgi:hypothetical protein